MVSAASRAGRDHRATEPLGQRRLFAVRDVRRAAAAESFKQA
jgi:hypothetical protein